MNNNLPGQVQSVGRRKAAVARVRLFKGQGPITVNGKPISDYFRGPVAQKEYQKPFEVTKTLGQFSGTIKVLGGGVASQLDAVAHGIAKALENTDKDETVKKMRLALKPHGLLTRDSRVRERRKFGLAGRARAKKQSPKR